LRSFIVVIARTHVPFFWQEGKQCFSDIRILLLLFLVDDDDGG
jgi:hypothetical protein|tara:strand:- start:150 stop:278 length:129 start_codon:yes stop_codon:yes gene_type:complete